MNKILGGILIHCIGAMFWMSPAQASFAELSIPQGKTLEIVIPRHDIEAIRAEKEGKTVMFYPLQRQPNFDEAITRGEFLELMFKNSSLPTGEKTSSRTFADVPSSYPYFQAVTHAAEQGIIDGYQDGNFGPYDPLTRGQIAKILVRTFGPTPTGNEMPLFSDVPSDHEFFPYIDQAVRAGLYKGYPDGLMRPDRSMNFSEVETVLRRATQKDFFVSLGDRDYWRAFIGFHRNNDSGTKTLNLTLDHDNGSQTQDSIAIQVLKRDYETVSFTLPATKTQLFEKTEQDNTWTMINAAKSKPFPEQLWEGTFIIPAVGEETLGFGDLLYINKKYSGSHFGLDWANVEGTEVHASNSGIVTLADWTPSYGNTVVIDHGQNVFTMYLHMSALKTSIGQSVKKGDLIGLMGATGVASGSHLHFTHFIGDIIVDSAEWLAGKY